MPLSKKINWAIIGLGKQAEKIAQAIAATPNNRLVAVMDKEKERARSFAKNWQVKNFYFSLSDLLRSADIDAVCVASPNYLHAEQSLAVIGAKKHVLCEKPMALNLNDSLAIKKAAQKNKIKFGVGFHLRFHPVWQTVKQIIAAGSLGEIRLIEMHWSTGVWGETKFPPLPKHMRWRENTILSGGGALMARGVHLIDLLNFITGKNIIEITGFTDDRKKNKTDQLAVGLMRTNNDILATFITGRQIPDADNRLVVYGSHGRLTANDPFNVDGTGELQIITGKGKQTKKFLKKMNVYQKEIAAFSANIENKKNCLADEIDGLKSVKAAAAFSQSALSGKPKL